LEGGTHLGTSYMEQQEFYLKVVNMEDNIQDFRSSVLILGVN